METGGRSVTGAGCAAGTFWCAFAAFQQYFAGKLTYFVLQTSDLRAVYQGVKFSCKFTFNEIAQRWYALIYDKTISKLALSAIRNLQADTIAHVEANCLYSDPEEEVLASVKSVSVRSCQREVYVFSLGNEYFNVFNSLDCGSEVERI